MIRKFEFYKILVFSKLKKVGASKRARTKFVREAHGLGTNTYLLMSSETNL